MNPVQERLRVSFSFRRRVSSSRFQFSFRGCVRDSAAIFPLILPAPLSAFGGRLLHGGGTGLAAGGKPCGFRGPIPSHILRGGFPRTVWRTGRDFDGWFDLHARPLARCWEGVSRGDFTVRASQGHGSWRFAPIRGRFSLAGDHWRMRKVLHLQWDRMGENNVKYMLYRFTGIGFNHSQFFEIDQRSTDRLTAPSGAIW